MFSRPVNDLVNEILKVLWYRYGIINILSWNIMKGSHVYA